jgi:hypothetical protein
MTRFRARPRVIEAWPWYPGRSVPGVGETAGGRSYVVTIHRQRVYLEPGDWVVPESDGVHHRVIKPDEMASGYDPID